MPRFVAYQTLLGLPGTMNEIAPNRRSTEPDDYQKVPRPVAAMAKSFVSGFVIAPHAHPRDQLLYAARGVMRVRTERTAWIVPPDRAVYVPGGIVHTVGMRGNVDMRTLYIDSGADRRLPRQSKALEVTELLRELILALIAEPVLYDEFGRGGALVSLILSEIVAAPGQTLGLPMPEDARLKRLCHAMLADPGCGHTLEDWSAVAGASSRTLARLFAGEVGMSFAAWRRRLRFHNALEALVAGHPIARVAADNGYHSASAFSAAYRRTMGVSPSRARIRPRDGADPRP